MGSQLVDQVLEDLPLSSGNFTDSYSENSYLAGQVWTYLPQSAHSDSTDSYSENSYLADQVFGDLPLSNGNFTDSSSDNSYLAGQVWTYLPQ